MLTNYKITNLVPNLVEPFNTKQHIDKLKELMTDRQESVVEFDLINISDKQANAIRRTMIDELDVVALDFDQQTLETKYEFILRDEIRDRIRFIPIDQTLKEDTVFSLDVLNNNPGDGIMTVYSNALKGPGSQSIPKKIRICELKPGSYLRIPKIIVRKGSGRQDSMFSLTSDIYYNNLDFMDIHCINKKANILTQRVAIADLLKTMTALGYRNINKREIIDKKILIIPDPNFDKLLTERDRKRIDDAKYDHKLILKDPKLRLEPQSSSMASSTEFRMRAYLLGNVDPASLVPMVCDNLISRLETVRTGVDEIKKNGTDPNGIVEVTTKLVVARNNDTESNQTLTVIRIRGETHTIGEMLVKHIYLLDSGIMNIKKRMNHPSESQVFIEMIHPNALKITLDAIDECLKVFNQIRKESTGAKTTTKTAKTAEKTAEKPAKATKAAKIAKIAKTAKK